MSQKIMCMNKTAFGSTMLSDPKKDTYCMKFRSNEFFKAKDCTSTKSDVLSESEYVHSSQTSWLDYIRISQKDFKRKRSIAVYVAIKCWDFHRRCFHLLFIWRKLNCKIRIDEFELKCGTTVIKRFLGVSFELPPSVNERSFLHCPLKSPLDLKMFKASWEWQEETHSAWVRAKKSIHLFLLGVGLDVYSVIRISE